MAPSAPWVSTTSSAPGSTPSVRARRRPSTTPLGSSGSSQLAPVDLLVDQAHPGVALDIHTAKRHAGRGLPRRGHAVGQQPARWRESLSARAARAVLRDPRCACRWRDCRGSRRRRPARPPPRGRGRCAPCSGGSPPSGPRRGSSRTARSSWPPMVTRVRRRLRHTFLQAILKISKLPPLSESLPTLACIAPGPRPPSRLDS